MEAAGCHGLGRLLEADGTLPKSVPCWREKVILMEPKLPTPRELVLGPLVGRWEG